MGYMRDYQSENTVERDCQLSGSDALSGGGDGFPRLLFIGNSITRHAPKADIGWYMDCGMAASAPMKDYVHLTMARVRESLPDAAYMIAQLADWERGFFKGARLLDAYRAAREWNPNIVIVRIGENIDDTQIAQHDLTASFIEMINYFSRGESATVITNMFYPHAVKDAAAEAVAKALDCPFVSLTEIGMNERMKAIGLFEHSGVASHPGDAGMKAISDVIYRAMAPTLVRIQTMKG